MKDGGEKHRTPKYNNSSLIFIYIYHQIFVIILRSNNYSNQMSSEDFKLASARASSKVFPEPSSNQKLQLYGLYKQATKGSGQDGKGRPGVMDPVGRAKFDAWAACGVNILC